METVQEVLAASVIAEDRVTLPSVQLDRSLYTKVNDVLSKAGGKWNRSAKAHLFSRDPRTVLAEYLESGKKPVSVKQQLQAFYTPQSLVERMVQLAQIEPEHLVLEPSAGDGRIAHAVQKLGGSVHVCEIDPVQREKLALEFRVVGEDFLEYNPQKSYDRILMNPPFTKGQDIKHVLHAFEHLKEGGKLVAITSSGWTFRSDKKHAQFREFAFANCSSYESLPEDTFKESGTKVKTELLVLVK